ncbi:hypothetical protein [Hymenobacter canadensis]|uniref:DUF1129 domain-containing protein n=1 Tax=Hymenobacter canadensis TaxID=2999067 RepID=A0ABY7LQZ6_9BACT|nr:hypothetical protein [Hymenobacter canadensis]WBA41318.1 hypothetical protein O3303_16040 [Hymenobacter canadensis]
MSEEYAEKMPRKNLSELLLYVRNRAEYREDAVLAALEELDRRGLPQPEAAEIRAEYGPIVEKQEKEKKSREATAAPVPGSRPTSAAGQPAAAEEPALYSPGTIVLFSMLPMSMMIGGGVLMAMNLFRLGRKRALLGLLLFMVVYLLVVSNVMAWAMLQGLNPYLAIVLFNVPAVLAYLFWFWPRYVQKATYRSRSLVPPMIICFALVWGLQLLMPYILKNQPPDVKQQMEQIMKRQ